MLYFSLFSGQIQLDMSLLCPDRMNKPITTRLRAAFGLCAPLFPGKLLTPTHVRSVSVVLDARGGGAAHELCLCTARLLRFLHLERAPVSRSVSRVSLALRWGGSRFFSQLNTPFLQTFGLQQPAQHEPRPSRCFPSDGNSSTCAVTRRDFMSHEAKEALWM